MLPILYHRSMLAAAPNQSRVLSFEDARRVVEDRAAQMKPRGKESVPLLNASGRILAEPIVADRDIPPFSRSTRDGYAIHAADAAQLPAKLQVIGEIKAGVHASDVPLKLDRGEAVAIMTGAPVPLGADAVVMVEYTAQEGRYVEITRGVEHGENVVAQGAEGRRSGLLLAPGAQLNHAAIALAASVGKSRVEVFLRPGVAVLTTGDEIVDIDSAPGPTQIRNSNSYSLAAQIQQAGGQPLLLPVAPDEPRQLRRRIEEGLQSELLLMTGGVSMGRYDLVEQVLSEMRAEFFFTGAKIQPGRPVVFGRVGCGAGILFNKLSAGLEAASSPEHKYFFGLPGNPVSTMVTFELFARPILEALAGMSPRNLVFVHARLKAAIHVKTGLQRFLPAILSGEFENSCVELIPWQGSGDIAATARANCYIVIPPDCGSIPAGEWAAVMMC
ncbi:MAG: gephyrin-like molybdotransferase Glp [Candidatus Sulfotelmatobacter sp.]